MRPWRGAMPRERLFPQPLSVRTDPGGHLCVAVPHPFAEMARERPGAPGYCTPYRYVDVIERSGASMTFESWRRPLSAYTEVLEQTGFVIEAMREPIPRRSGARRGARVGQVARAADVPSHSRAPRAPVAYAALLTSIVSSFSEWIRMERPAWT